MAHQAHNIPWQTLASSLKLVQDNKGDHGKTNIYSKHKPDQGKQLAYFTKALAKTLEEFSLTERAKYAEKYELLDPDDIIISPVTERKIKKTVERHNDPTLPLSLEEKRVSYWIDYSNPSFCWNFNAGRCRCKTPINLLKMLLLHGEMDTILKIAAQWNICLRPKSNFPGSFRIHGWTDVAVPALTAYICLNVLYLRPETYDPTFRKTWSDQSAKKGEELDYRRTSSYQKMLVCCTGDCLYDSHTYPHREFFGVAPGTYRVTEWDIDSIFGPASLSKTRHIVTYLPTRSDIPLVRRYLRATGLPTELILHVLELAEYVPQQRQIIPDDPFHVQNRTELRKYLNYCWQLLIRCDLLGKACGGHFNWESHARECIMHLWGVEYQKVTKRHAIDQLDNIGFRNSWNLIY